MNNQELELKYGHVSPHCLKSRENDPLKPTFTTRTIRFSNSYICTNARQTSGGVLGERFVFCCGNWQQAPSGETNAAIRESFFSGG